MTQAFNRQTQGRDTGAGGSSAAVVSPSGLPVTRTTDELLSELVLLARAIVLGLEGAKEVDLFAMVGLPHP